MTNSQRMRERAVMISSTMPSAKYSRSGSPLILAKGSTAIGRIIRPGRRCSVAFCRAGWFRRGRNRIGCPRFALRTNADLTGELVALAGNRLDQVAVRSKRLAQRPNLALQPVFLDDPARPDPAQQLVLAKYSPRRLKQRHQQVEGASAEPYRPAFGEQLAAMRQDAEAAKFDDRRRVGQANHDRQL